MFKKLFAFFILILIVSFTLVFFLYYSQSQYSSKIKSFIPMNIKENIKQIVFLIPEMIKKSDQHYDALKKANRDIAILQNKLNEFLINGAGLFFKKISIY